MTFLLNGRIRYQCGRKLEWVYYNATSIYAAVKESCSRLQGVLFPNLPSWFFRSLLLSDGLLFNLHSTSVSLHTISAKDPVGNAWSSLTGLLSIVFIIRF